MCSALIWCAISPITISPREIPPGHTSEEFGGLRVAAVQVAPLHRDAAANCQLVPHSRGDGLVVHHQQPQGPEPPGHQPREPVPGRPCMGHCGQHMRHEGKESSPSGCRLSGTVYHRAAAKESVNTPTLHNMVVAVAEGVGAQLQAETGAVHGPKGSLGLEAVEAGSACTPPGHTHTLSMRSLGTGRQRNVGRCTRKAATLFLGQSAPEGRGLRKQSPEHTYGIPSSCPSPTISVQTIQHSATAAPKACTFRKYFRASLLSFWDLCPRMSSHCIGSQNRCCFSRMARELVWEHPRPRSDNHRGNGGGNTSDQH